MTNMKHQPIIFLFFLSCCSLSLSGQPPQLLKAQGEIPREFISLSSDKYKKELESIRGKKGNRKKEKREKQFALESNFAVDNILQSGLVLFNDAATVYVNQVLQQLPFENERSNRKDPRAYVLNSSAVNAFATDQGIIFVTLGMLANLENEAQLAFVLAHELMHFQYRHSINKFIRFEGVGGGRPQREKNAGIVSIDAHIFEQSMYSRALEEEADEEGLKLFLQSGYDPEVIRNTFHVLHYSYLPFGDSDFERSFWEDKNFIFPKELWLDTVNNVIPMETAEEEKSTSHPSTISRLKKMEEWLAGEIYSGKKAFLNSEAAFYEIREKARYQLPFLYLNTENFEEAIYTAYLLLQQYPTDMALKKVVGKALYMHAKYTNVTALEDDHWTLGSQEDLADETEGPIHRVYHLLSHLEAPEITILAVRYNWKLYQEQPEDKELKWIVEDLFVELARHFADLSAFKATEYVPEPDSLTVVKPEAAAPDEPQRPWLAGSDAVTTITTAPEEPKKERNFWKYAFVEALNSPAFTGQYKKGQQTLQEELDQMEYYDTREGQREWTKQQKEEEYRGKRLGVDKVVVINPFYLSLDERNGGVQYLRAEDKQIFFRNAIRKLSGLTEVTTTVLDVSALSANEVDQFNDIAALDQYFEQQMAHFDLTLTPAYHQDEIDRIADKYGTEYFLWTGVIALQKKNYARNLYMLSLIFPPLFPAAILKSATPNYDMLYYAILFDVKSGRRSIIKMDYFNKRDNRSILQAHIYDVFYQIGRPAK
jgi:Zn-dependent protease with chaperone function